MYYSETQFYTEIKRTGGKVQLQNQNGENIIVEESYLDLLNSTDRFDKTEKATMTELSGIIRESPNRAMSICYQKVDKPKTKKAFKEEKESKIKEIQSAKVSEVETLLSNLIDNPILDYIPGEMRLIKGYNPGGIGDNMGSLILLI